MANLYPATVKCNDYVNLRASASTDGTIRGKLYNGDTIYIDDAGTDNNFVTVKNRSEGTTLYATRANVNVGTITNPTTAFFGGSGSSNNIKSGAAKWKIYNLQWALYSLGWAAQVGTPDGVWGSKTESAVKLFQSWWHLTSDGICGDATKNQLIHHMKNR